MKKTLAGTALAFAMLSAVAAAPAASAAPGTGSSGLIPASPSGSVAAPVEDSDGGGILLLGDSVFANPDFLGAPNIDAARAGDLDNVTCGRGSDRVANRLAELVDVPVHDYSCPGATAVDGLRSSPRVQVDSAIRAGALTENTTHVALLFGFNDFYLATPELPDQYVAAVGTQIERIRSIAPNAKIMVVSYPEITDEAGNACFVHVSGVTDPALRVQPLQWLEDLVHDTQRRTADETNSTFVDVRAATEGHGLCAPDEVRYMSGYVDFEQEYNLTTHLTSIGNERVAEILAENL